MSSAITLGQHTLSEQELDMTVEDYLKMVAEQEVAALMQHTRQQVDAFKRSAEEVKRQIA